MIELTKTLVGSTLATCLVAAAGLMSHEASADDTTVKLFSYAAKAVCESETYENVETKVNIHNPRFRDVTFYWKAVLAEEAGEEHDGIVPVIQEASLGADGAAFIDCDTLDDIGVTGDFEGFIVVLSRTELDVVGLYEMEVGDPIRLVDMDVVPVSSKVITVAVTTLTGP